MVFIWTAFVTGLLAGGASCAAVQGGLLAGLAARRTTAEQQVQQSAPAAAAARAGAKRSGSNSLSPAAARAARVKTASAARSNGGGTSTAPAPWRPPTWREEAGSARSGMPRTASARADAVTVVMFLAGKLAAYTVLGFGLGLLGQAVQLTPEVQAIMLIAAGLIMVIMALDLMGVQAVRRLVPTPPASWTRLVRREARSSSHFAPLGLGAATVLLPCGVTISMEVAAIATGSPLLGAAIMAAFVIGTIPLFFVIGFAAHRFTGAWGGRLAAITGVVVLIAGLFAINNGLNLSGSPVTLASVAGLSEKKVEGTATAATAATGGKQQIVIEATAGAFTPNEITAKAGVPTDLVLRSVNVGGCTSYFTIPSLDVGQRLPVNGDTTIALGALPPGDIRFACGMGMVTGNITVTA